MINFTGDWPNIGPRICRMPQIIAGLLIPFLSSTPLIGAIGFGGLQKIAVGLGYLAFAGGSIALQLALQKKPPAAQPSDVQANIRQEISARRRIYGRTLAGSVLVFGFRRGEKSYLLHYIGEGPILGFLSFRLDKKPVFLDGDGFVLGDQYIVNNRSRVQLKTTMGLMTDEPFLELLSAFPELNDPLKPFRHRGCVMVLQIVEQVPAEKLSDTYPNNMPSLQVVIDGLVNIYDPATSAYGFTDNAGRCLLAECMDVYGLTSTDTEEINFASFATFIDHCDDDIPLKAGGFEKRYRCAGTIFLDAENEERIKAIASICNADVYLDPQGRIAVRQKLRSEPGISLRARNGDHLEIALEGGRGLQKKFNTVKPTYVDPALNYKQNELIWRHAGFLEDDGEELVEPLQLLLCPSGTQAQRLSKLFLFERNPDFIGQLLAGPQALDLLEDYCFRLDLTEEEGFDRVACAADGIDFDPEALTVSAAVMVFAEGAANWDPAVDEQDQLLVPPSLPSRVDDVALDVTVTVQLLSNSAPILAFSWEAVGSALLPDSYSQQVQVSAAEADDWTDAIVNQEGRTAQFSPVADGGAYDWRIRNIARGKTFDWQSSVSPVTVVVDNVPPQALVMFSASDGEGQFVGNFGSLNDPHLATVAIYRVPMGDPLVRATHIVGPPYAVAPGISYAIPVTSSAGNFDVYAEPFNRSGIAGPLAGPDAATVT